MYLDGPEEVMVKRLAGRGRSDDNEETIKKRLRVNKRDAQPVVEYYDKLNKVKKIRCDDTREGMFRLDYKALTKASCLPKHHVEH